MQSSSFPPRRGLLFTGAPGRDHRVMYDVIEDDRVVLVLGVVHRTDLERWLKEPLTEPNSA